MKKQQSIDSNTEITEWKDIAVLNMYVPIRGAPKYMKQKLIELKGKIDKSTIRAEDFNTPFSIINTTR